MNGHTFLIPHMALTALQLMAGGKRDWMVLVKRVTFPKGSGGRMEVAFP